MENSEYKSKFSVLSDLDKAREEADKLHQKLSLAHVDASARLWPSMASIRRQIVHPGGYIDYEVVGACLRQSYYYATGETPTEQRNQRASDSGDLGKIVEDIYLDRFRGIPGYQVIYPDVTGRKLRFKRDGISGEVDLVMQHLETKELFGIEMKSYDGAWAAIELAGYEKAREIYKSTCPYIPKYLGPKGSKRPNPAHYKKPFPKPINLLQTMLYLDEFAVDGIKLWKIIYVARDKGPRVEFDVSLAEHENQKVAQVNGIVYPEWPLQGIYDRYNQIVLATKQRELPSRDYVPEYDSDKLLDDDTTPKWLKDKLEAGYIHRSWSCDYCPFLQKCLDDGE